jgi:hypothetical protein
MPSLSGAAGRRISGRPEDGEFAAYAKSDIDEVRGDDAAEALRLQERMTLGLLQGYRDEDVRGLRYAPDKWTVKEVLGHLADDERIFGYRILCIARGDTRPLPGFDEQEYMRDSGFEARRLGDVLAEYRCVRQATIALLEGMPDQAWQRRGIVNGYRATVRGLAFHIAGHELRHLRALRERYLRPR